MEKMNKKRSRFLAIILTICMIATMLPVMAFADEAKADEVKNYTITLIANHDGAKFYTGYEGATYSDNNSVVTFTCPSNESIEYAKGYPYRPYINREGSESVWWECYDGFWNSKADGTGEEFDPRTTRPSHDMTLYATWSQMTRVTLHANGGHFGNSASNTDATTIRILNKEFYYDENAPISPEGKAFTGWYRDPECTQKVESLPREVITETNRDFYAGWTEQNVVTLTLDPNGGTFKNFYEPYMMKDGKLHENLIAGENADYFYRDNIQRDGYRFTGWYLDSSCTQEVQNRTINKDTTFYAGWTQVSDNNYMLTLVAEAPGYYWSENKDGYSERVHSLTYPVPKGSTISEAEQLNGIDPYPRFDTATVMLDAMYLNQNATGRIDYLGSYKPSQDTTLYAIYKEYSNVKWYAGEGGYFKYRSRNGENINFDVDQVFKGDAADPSSDILDGSALANTDPNLTFLGWYKQDPATGEMTDEKLDPSKKLVPNGDVTYQAKWVTGNEVTFNLNGGTTSIEEEDGSWNDNATVLKKQVPDNTSVEQTLATFEKRIWKDSTETDRKTALTGWYTDQECTKPYDLTAPVTAPITLYAKWEEPKITISVSPSDSVKVGEQITATATQNARNASNYFYWYLESNFNDDGQSIFVQMNDSNEQDKFIIQAANAGTAKIECNGNGWSEKEITAVAVSEDEKKPAISASANAVAKNSVSGDHHRDEITAANTLADALSSKNDSTTGEGVNQAVTLAMSNNTIDTEAYRDTLKTKDESITDETKLSTVYETYMDYNVTDVNIPAIDSQNDPKSLTFEATPMVQKYVTSEDVANGAKAGTETLTESNSVKIGEPAKLNIVAPVTMNIPVTNDLFSDTDTIYVQHESQNGYKQYDAKLENSAETGKYVTFENPDGFSTFTITTEDRSDASVDGKYYFDFSDAINTASQTGKAMVLHKDFDENAIAWLDGIGTVTVDVNGHKFDPEKVNLSSDEYEIKWTKSDDGNTYTATISEKQKEPDNPSHHSGGSFNYNPTPVKTFVFDDVKDSEKFYYNPVYWAYKTGITAGTSEKTFSPTAVCTRAQIVTMLWKKAGSPASSMDISKFTDVKADKFYAKAVAWALEKGITTGTTQTTFSPNAKCTRAQAMTFLYKMEKAQNTSSANPFSDVSKEKYYYNPVLWGVANGITTGTTQTTFTPSGEVNRGQMVTFLYNLYSGEKATK